MKTMTKLTAAQQVELWVQAGARLGAASLVMGGPRYSAPNTQRQLIGKGLMQSAAVGRQYGISEAGRAWIAEQIEAAHAEALMEGCGKPDTDRRAFRAVVRSNAFGSRFSWSADLLDRDHAEALAEEDKRWGNHIRQLNNETGAQLDQIAAWVVRHHECCGNNAFATPERRIAHDRESAVLWGSDADQLAAEQQYTAWTERFKASGEADLDRDERIAADEAEAYMERSLADQFERVSQAQRWLDRHGIDGRRTDVMRAMGVDHAEALDLDKLPAWERIAILGGCVPVGIVHSTDGDRVNADQIDRSLAAHANCTHSHKFGGDYKHDHEIALDANKSEW